MENLNFFIPAEFDLVKSDSSQEEVRRIRGYASTPVEDREQEEIIQKGLDISDFLNYGWFNYDHDNTKILGYPDKNTTKITPQGFYVEGNLLKGIPLADYVWDVAKALKKSNAPRKLGFSIEGKILEKDTSGRIMKAKVYNVAITPNPVNPTATWDAVVKSFSAPQENLGAQAGYNARIGEINNGACLKQESLDSAFRILASILDETEDSKEKRRQLRELLVSKSLTNNEMILYLQLCKGLSRQQAVTILKSLK